METKISLVDYARSIKTDIWDVDTSKSVCRLLYVHSGSAVVHYAKKNRTLTAGHVYLLPSSDDFRPVTWERYFDVYFFDYYCSPALRSDSFTEIDASLYSLSQMFQLIEPLRESKSISINTAKHFLSTILSVINDNMDLPYINDSIITDALELIRKNFTTITSKELAKQLNLNESYFIKRFSHFMGVPPMKYIRSMRLAEGQMMLKNGMHVSQVAEKCGYSTPNAFWKAVRKEFGCSPSKLKAP